MTTLVAFDAANPTISAAAMVKHGGIVAPVYIVGNPGGMPHSDKARVAELRAAGLAPLPNWERAADFFAHATLSDALQAGREALAACRELGFPDDGSIDVAFSLDFQVPPNRYAEMARLLDACNTGLAGHYRAIAYAQTCLIDYLAAHGQPGPHWLMGSTWGQAYRPASPHVSLVQSHDATGTWLNSPIPGTDINTVTQPHAIRAWWPDGSPYGGNMALDPKDPVIVALNAKIDRVYSRIWESVAVVVNGDAGHPNSQAAIGPLVRTLAAVLGQPDGVTPRVAAIQAAIDQLQTAVAGITPAEVAQLDADQVASKVLTALNGATLQVKA